MEIYIEYILIDNLVINYLVITLTNKFIHLNISKYRTCLGAVVGTVFAFIMPFFNFDGIMLFFIKMLIGLFIVLSILNNNQLRHLMRYYLSFIMFTFVMGGLAMAVIYVCTSELSFTNYSYDIPVGAMILLIFIWSKFLIKIINAIYKRKNIIDYFYEMELNLRNKDYVLNAYLDSGNLWVDTKTDKPIIIVELKKIINEFSTDELRALFLGDCKALNFTEAHFQEFEAMSTKGKMLVVEPKKLTINNNNCDLTKKVMVAISIKPLNRNGDFDALLSPKCI